MDLETKDKRLPLNFPATDSALRTTCPRAALARFQSSPPCGKLSLRVWSSARYRGNFSAGIISPARTETIHRRIQDRPAAARCVRKVGQHQDGQRAIPARL